MAKADLEEFFELVAVGDRVELVGRRNQQTAQLFGSSQNPSAAMQTQTAKSEPANSVAPAPSTSATTNPSPALVAGDVAAMR
jgi:hypothetical protein